VSSGHKIRLSGIKIRDGKVVKTAPRMSVSRKIAARKSKRVRVAKKGIS
jgi:hypothetical protein